MTDIGLQIDDNTSFQRQLWRILRWLAAYRLSVACLFLFLAFFIERGESPQGYRFPLFFSMSLIYGVIALISVFSVVSKRPSITTQIDAFIFIDIFAILIFMYSRGGVESGIGILLIVAVAAGSLLSERRIAFAFAAVASFLVLGEQTYQVVSENASVGLYLHAGLLGLTLFITALVASVISQQLHYSNRLALQRGVDLQNLSKLNEYIIQRMEAGVIVVDEKNRVRLINEAARFLLGLPGQLRMQPLADISTELQDQLNAWRQMPNRESNTFRVTGSVAIFPRFSAMSMHEYEGVLALLEDTSMLDQQAQTLKMSAMGRLTASIAHEIRNPLGAISHAGQLLEESPNLDGADKRLTRIIREQSARMNTIIENVMQLSRRNQAVPEVIVLNDWLKLFIEEFIKSHKVEPGDVGVHVSSELIEISMDASHLHQILSNLCQNALRYGHAGGRKKRLELNASIADNGRSVHVDVIDNGPGIEPETSRQIFEPFFTTASKGTGLGLYIARELAEANQAHLDYVPVPAGGSCFRISFSIHKKELRQSH